MQVQHLDRVLVNTLQCSGRPCQNGDVAIFWQSDAWFFSLLAFLKLGMCTMRSMESCQRFVDWNWTGFSITFTKYQWSQVYVLTVLLRICGRAEGNCVISCLFFLERNTNKCPKVCPERSVPGCTAVTLPGMCRPFHTCTWNLMVPFVQVPASLPRNIDLLVKHWILLFTSKLFIA